MKWWRIMNPRDMEKGWAFRLLQLTALWVYRWVAQWGKPGGECLTLRSGGGAGSPGRRQCLQSTRVRPAERKSWRSAEGQYQEAPGGQRKEWEETVLAQWLVLDEGLLWTSLRNLLNTRRRARPWSGLAVKMPEKTLHLTSESLGLVPGCGSWLQPAASAVWGKSSDGSSSWFPFSTYVGHWIEFSAPAFVLCLCLSNKWKQKPRPERILNICTSYLSKF